MRNLMGTFSLQNKLASLLNGKMFKDMGAFPICIFMRIHISKYSLSESRDVLLSF